MKRNKIIEGSGQDVDVLIEQKQCIAFHEAGHAIAIYLNNKAGNLPPVFFQITLNKLSGKSEEDLIAHHTTHDDYIARVEGGRLIELLPDSLVHTTTGHNDTTQPLTDEYMAAFETDIVNFLIGSLSVAKHIADVDDELFNQRLVNLEALKNYGGGSDLVLITQYIQRFSACKQQQDKKLDELFGVAFNFINDRANWAAITRLANSILKGNKNIISCEDVALLVKQLRAANEKPAALLFVDDEANVLNALRRLFHNEHYVTYFAASGAEGLEILQHHAVDLIISDMRMPKMNGAEFLTHVVMQWPETIRILLTGYSDMQSTIEAINKGRIYNYCNKPWDDDELKLLVRNALDQKASARKA